MESKMFRSQRSRAWALPCVVVLICLAGAMSAFAQQTGGGTLTGTVSDKDGVVPGASVTVTAAATNTSRTSPTNESGLFRVAGLAPGTYTIKVEVTGFKTLTMSDILLTAGEIRVMAGAAMVLGDDTLRARSDRRIGRIARGLGRGEL